MKKITIIGLAIALLSGAGLLQAADMPQMPPPVKEHEWLQQFVGEWESETEVFMEFKSKDHRIFTSSMQGEDGKWTTMVKASFRRKK